MVPAVARAEFLVGRLVGEERLHALDLKLHFNIGGELVYHFFHSKSDLLLRIEGRADRSEEVGIVGVNNVLLVEIQGADKGDLELGKEVQGTSEKGNMSTNRFAAGKAGDRLVYHSLKDGRSKVFLCRAFVD